MELWPCCQEDPVSPQQALGLCPGERGAPSAPALPITVPTEAPGALVCCLPPNPKRCVQEELTSTSVEHLIINPNAAYEKFRDKRLGTEGVGEPRSTGKAGLGGTGGFGVTPLLFSF